MNSQVLYRKYRPKTFSEVVGQEHIIRTLKNELEAESVSHAYLFCGPRGTGKTTVARLLAKALNCRNRRQGESEPCNQCDFCLEINEGRAIDLIEIDAASNRGIDEIRQLKEGIGFIPVKSKYKVFIIDESHQLTKEASNALLKTLEEPPAHAVFILATTESHKMIPTIVSRCQRFDFRKLRVEEITKRLAKILEREKISFEPEALALIAFSAGGAQRDAESMLEQVISFCGFDKKIEKKEVEELLGLVEREIILRFLEYLSQKNAKEAVELLNSALFSGVDPAEFSKSLIRMLRELLFFKINPQPSNSLILELTEEERRGLANLANRFSERELKEIINQFVLADQKVKFASIPQLPLELAVVEVCQQKKNEEEKKEFNFKKLELF